MEEVLRSPMFEVPSDPDVARVLISRAVVLENVNPTIVPRSIPSRRSSRQDREEKSA
jgi:ATP-dependent Clp protease ATP-binding subunit ClpX